MPTRFTQRPSDHGRLKPWEMDAALGVPPRSDAEYRALDAGFTPHWELDQDDSAAVAAAMVDEVVREAERRGLARPTRLEWSLSQAFAPGLAWELAAAALHGTPAPDWSQPWWTDTRLQTLGRHLRNCLSGDPVALCGQRRLFAHLQVLFARRMPCNPVDAYALAVVETPDRDA
jgi:hypothetical protein